MLFRLDPSDKESFSTGYRPISEHAVFGLLLVRCIVSNKAHNKSETYCRMLFRVSGVEGEALTIPSSHFPIIMLDRAAIWQIPFLLPIVLLVCR